MQDNLTLACCRTLCPALLPLLLAHCFVQVLNDPLQLAFADVTPNVQYVASSSPAAAAEALPLNVHLLTVRWLSCSTVLVRLSHMFQAGEDQAMSQPATVQLAALAKLLQLKVTKVQEATLFGERALTAGDERRPQYNISEVLTTWQPPLLLPAAALSFTSNRMVGPIPLSARVTLNPMQVRAFYFTVSRSSSCSDPEIKNRSQEGGAPVASGTKGANSKPVSVLVRHLPGIDPSVAHVASLSYSALLLLLLVPTGIAVGIAAACLVGRSHMQKIVAAATKQEKFKSIARNEYINL